MNQQHWRQRRQRRERRTEIVRGKAQLADMRRQRRLVVRRMLDGMRARRQLGEEQDNNEKKMAQRLHRRKFNRPGSKNL